MARSMVVVRIRLATRLALNEQALYRIGGYDIGMVLVIGWYVLDLVVTIFSDSATSLLLDGRRLCTGGARRYTTRAITYCAKMAPYRDTQCPTHVWSVPSACFFAEIVMISCFMLAQVAPLVHPVALENEASVFCLF